MERHPDFFEEAKSYEKNAIDHGSPFTWSQGESLDDLAKPKRVAQIREEHQQRLDRMRGNRHMNPLRPDAEPIDIDDLYGQAKGLSGVSQVIITPPNFAMAGSRTAHESKEGLRQCFDQAWVVRGFHSF